MQRKSETVGRRAKPTKPWDPRTPVTHMGILDHVRVTLEPSSALNSKRPVRKRLVKERNGPGIWDAETLVKYIGGTFGHSTL